MGDEGLTKSVPRSLFSTFLLILLLVYYIFIREEANCVIYHVTAPVIARKSVFHSSDDESL